MKKLTDFLKRSLFILLGTVLILLPADAFAVSSENAYQRAVWDIYGLLSEEQADELDAMAFTAAEAYGCGIYMVIVPDYTEFSQVSAYEAATALYDQLDLGYGGDRNGELLLLSVNDRDYALIAHGETGNSAFTDYGKEKLEDKFLDDFAADDFYTGFKDYIRESERYLKAEAAGQPVDVSPEGAAGTAGAGFLTQIMKLFGSILASAAAALGLSKSMKSVSAAFNADHYKVQGSFELKESRDTYLRRSVSRRNIDSGGKNDRPGGGGTSIGSGGFSGHSGKF